MEWRDLGQVVAEVDGTLSSHYYDQKPETAHQRREIEARIRGVTLHLLTDSGVFSKTGVDYGSRFLIENLELPESGDLLDVGCGYGPIGLFAARLNPRLNVTMIDINERAVELANINAVRNGIRNASAVQSDLFEQVRDRSYSLIVSNPPIRAGKRVVYRIFEEGVELLKDGGQLWIVIQKKQGAPSAYEKLKSLYREVVEVAKSKGYRVYKAVK